MARAVGNVTKTQVGCQGSIIQEVVAQGHLLGRR